jgi:hypothetical protein
LESLELYVWVLRVLSKLCRLGCAVAMGGLFPTAHRQLCPFLIATHFVGLKPGE